MTDDIQDELDLDLSEPVPMKRCKAQLQATMETDLIRNVEFEVPADFTEQQISELLWEAQRDMDGSLFVEEDNTMGGGWRNQDAVGIETVSKKFEVLTRMVLAEPENLWTVDEKPQYFDTRAEAQAEIDEHIADLEAAIARGDMSETDGTDPDTYIIQEVMENG